MDGAALHRRRRWGGTRMRWQDIREEQPLGWAALVGAGLAWFGPVGYIGWQSLANRVPGMLV